MNVCVSRHVSVVIVGDFCGCWFSCSLQLDQKFVECYYHFTSTMAGFNDFYNVGCDCVIDGGIPGRDLTVAWRIEGGIQLAIVGEWDGVDPPQRLDSVCGTLAVAGVAVVWAYHPGPHAGSCHNAGSPYHLALWINDDDNNDDDNGDDTPGPPGHKLRRSADPADHQ